ncbi:MAG: helix-turn-helix domain-containing protein [Vagococcus sp.]|uniref:helix-turn-helix domain-containing protein n=1 Tax=Vagococcus TaxID=2737 RepID=UPI002FCBB79E
MKHILEPIYQRQIDILDYLLMYNKKISLNELSSFVNSSESTVLRDISYFQENFYDYIQINSTNFKEIQLINTSSQQVKQVQSVILNSSINIRVMTNIFLTPFKTIDYYSTLLNTSNSSIYKSIKDINHKLKDYQIKIKRVSQKYFIFAHSEQLLRELLGIFWVEIHLLDFEESISDYAQIISKFNNYTDIFITNQLIKDYYFSFIFVSIVREKEYFFLTDYPLSPNNDSQEEMVNRIKKSIQYSPYIDNIFFNNRNFYKLTNYIQNDLLNSKNKEDSLPLFNLIRKIYENEVSHQIPIKLFIGQLTFFHNELKKDSYVYREIKSIIFDIENILQVNLDTYVPLLSYILIVYYPDVLRLHSQNNDIIYVHSSISKRHSIFLVYQLNTYFNDYYNFQVIETLEVASIKKKSLIITNSRKLNFSNAIIIDEYITKKDFNKIEFQIVLFLNKKITF